MGNHKSSTKEILKLLGSSFSVKYQLHQANGSVTLCMCGVRERERRENGVGGKSGPGSGRVPVWAAGTGRSSDAIFQGKFFQSLSQ